jgi:signal transduction histidine kinase
LRSFWGWIGWLAAVWAAFLIDSGSPAIPWGILGAGIFFAFYFVVPVFRGRPAALFAALTGALITANLTIPWIGLETGSFAGNLYALLITFYLAGEAAYRLPLRWAIANGALAAAVTVLSAILFANGPIGLLPPFLLLSVVAFAAALAVYWRESAENLEARARYEALLEEYRKLKRQAKSNEEAARMEERTAIARQIHDSVGHKLTSLLMQLEMFRMNAEGEMRSQAEQMKQLAKASLEETRNAVKSLKEQEPGGIPAVIRLIRNLEAESYLQVQFNILPGALSVRLNNEQSIAVYRGIQEALTNAMRHGSSRRVKIQLESPGGRIFRFEVVNETDKGSETSQVREGFGLSAMRERTEKAGGKLELIHEGGRFIVRGTFPLEDEKE